MDLIEHCESRKKRIIHIVWQSINDISSDFIWIPRIMRDSIKHSISHYKSDEEMPRKI